MSHDAHVLDLLPAYALGSLDSEEASHVEGHLASCLICRNESNDLQSVTEQLSLAAPAQIPSPDLKDRLMQRVLQGRRSTQIPARAPRRLWLERLLPVWSLASVCLVIALAGLNLFLWQRLVQPRLFMSAEGMRAVPLISTGVASQATGFVLISKDGDSGALIVDGLPPLDESRQYQVWLIRDGQRLSGALFSTDAKEYGTTRIRAPGSLLEYSAVDITIEPAGGSPQPTGAKVLGGPLLNP